MRKDDKQKKEKRKKSKVKAKEPEHIQAEKQAKVEKALERVLKERHLSSHLYTFKPVVKGTNLEIHLTVRNPNDLNELKLSNFIGADSKNLEKSVLDQLTKEYKKLIQERPSDTTDRPIKSAQTLRFANTTLHITVLGSNEPVPLKPDVAWVPRHGGKFIPRPVLWNDLKKTLQTSSMTVLCPLAGMGGMGKTKLAIEYIERAKRQDKELSCNYYFIRWFEADNPKKLEEILRERARETIETLLSRGEMSDFFKETMDYDKDSIQKIMVYFYRVLDHYHEKIKCYWLVVFDNAIEENMKYFLPQLINKGRILITTRDSDAFSTYKTIPVDVFKEEEALNFLKDRLKGKNESDYKKLAEILGCIPLALEQAVAAIRNHFVDNVVEYIQHFEQNKLKFLETLSKPADKTAQKPITMLAVWETSIQFACKKSSISQEIFNLCAYLHYREIPVWIMERTWGEKKSRAALQALQSVSLIHWESGERVFSLHPLMQEITRLKLTYPKPSSTDLSQWMTALWNALSLGHDQSTPKETPETQGIAQALQKLHAVCEYDRDRMGAVGEMETLVPHFQTLLDHVKRLKPTDTGVAALVCRFYWKLGHYFAFEKDHSNQTRAMCEAAARYAEQAKDRRYLARIHLLWADSTVELSTARTRWKSAKQYYEGLDLLPLDQVLGGLVEGDLLQKEKQHSAALRCYQIVRETLDTVDTNTLMLERALVLQRFGNLLWDSADRDTESLSVIQKYWNQAVQLLRELYGSSIHKNALVLDLLHRLIRVSAALKDVDGVSIHQAQVNQLLTQRQDAAGYRLEGQFLYEQQQYEAAHRALDQALDLDANEGEAHNLKGVLFAEQGEFDSALGCYQKARELAPKEPVYWGNEGGVLYELKHYADSHEALAESLRLNPKDAWAHNQKGRVFFAEGKYELALGCYQKARELAPTHAAYWANEGAALHRLKRYAEAHKALDQALALNPKDVWAHNQKGRVFIAEEKYELALGCFQKARELDPKNAVYWGNEGGVLYELKHYADSHEALAESLRLNPQCAWAHNQKGRVFIAEEKYELALGCFQKARELDPKNAVYWGNEGSELYELKRYAEVHQALSQALELNPKSVRAHNQKGRVFIAEGKWVQGLACFLQIHEWINKNFVYSTSWHHLYGLKPYWAKSVNVLCRYFIDSLVLYLLFFNFPSFNWRSIGALIMSIEFITLTNYLHQKYLRPVINNVVLYLDPNHHKAVAAKKQLSKLRSSKHKKKIKKVNVVKTQEGNSGVEPLSINPVHSITGDSNNNTDRQLSRLPLAPVSLTFSHEDKNSDLLLKILGCLTFEALQKTRLVNKRWCKVSDEILSKKQKSLKQFPIVRSSHPLRIFNSDSIEDSNVYRSASRKNAIYSEVLFTTLFTEKPKDLKYPTFDAKQLSNNRDYFDAMTSALAAIPSQSLPESETYPADIIRYLKFSLKAQTACLVADTVWNLMISEKEKSQFFMKVDFPYETFLRFFINPQIQRFIVPINITGSHFGGCVMIKTVHNTAECATINLECRYVNPTSTPEKNSAEDRAAFDAMKHVFDEFKKHLLPQLMTSHFDGQVKDKHHPSFKIRLDKNKGRAFSQGKQRVDVQYTLNNVSCSQQISTCDCGFIVAQDLVDIAQDKAVFMISPFKDNAMACILAIARVRHQFYVGQVQAIRQQYFLRLAKALCENKPYCKDICDWLLNKVALDRYDKRSSEYAFLFCLWGAAIKITSSDGFKNSTEATLTESAKLYLQSNIYMETVATADLKQYCQWLLTPIFKAQGSVIFTLNPKRLVQQQDTVFSEDVIVEADDLQSKFAVSSFK